MSHSRGNYRYNNDNDVDNFDPHRSYGEIEVGVRNNSYNNNHNHTNNNPHHLTNSGGGRLQYNQQQQYHHPHHNRGQYPANIDEIVSDIHPLGTGFGGGGSGSRLLHSGDIVADGGGVEIDEASITYQDINYNTGSSRNISNSSGTNNHYNSNHHQQQLHHHNEAMILLQQQRFAASMGGGVNMDGQEGESVAMTQHYEQQKLILQELRDPAYLINTLEDMIPKIINGHYHSSGGDHGNNQNNNNNNNNNNAAGGGANNNKNSYNNNDKQQQHHYHHGDEEKRKNRRQIENQQRRDQAEQVWERVRRWLWANPIDDTVVRSAAAPDGGTIAADDNASLTAINNGNTRSAGAYVRGLNDMTPLHLVCKLFYPPEDIINALLQAAPDTASWPDSHGWLPLHHASANGCSSEVMAALIEAYPQGTIYQDQQKRTPMHFYATRSSQLDNPSAMATNATLLCELVGDGSDAISAAQLTDNNGMLPMHYASAYGTHPAVLEALAIAYTPALTARERNGRTPMHLAMVNAHREESPAVLRFLLEYSIESNETINSRDKQGYLPLHLLAAGLKQQMAVAKTSSRISDDPEKRATVSECLSLYLSAEPKAAADFLTAIQDLPDWLQDTAVVSKHVRNILNEKIVQRFPTSILMLDGIVLVALIVCFAKTTKNHINLRFDPDNTINETRGSLVIVVCGATYFLLREMVQFASLMSLGNIVQWFTDPNNWLDMSVIVLVFYYGIMMLLSDTATMISNDAFRTGIAFTQGTLWVAIIMYLKSTLVDFAVFVGGVFYVVQRLVAFLIAVGVILLAFAQMFYFVYVDTPMCELDPNRKETTVSLPSGEHIHSESYVDCDFPHCRFDTSLLKVYTMMMGEIGNESRYATSLVAQILYIGFAFLVVILLSNVLIAIVTDSYEVIQNDRAAIVFWSNRLDFVAEMDSIVYAIQSRLGLVKTGDDIDDKENDKRSVIDAPEQPPAALAGDSGHHHIGIDGTDVMNNQDSNSRLPDMNIPHSGSTPSVRRGNHGSTEYFRGGWQQVMSLFDANFYEDVDWIDAWIYNIFRIFSIICIIPLWVALGFVTAGLLWPPQVREFLFVQKETAISRAELDRQKLSQLKAITTDLKDLKHEIMREMLLDRDEMLRLKADIETVQGEVYADVLQVKELLDSLLIVNQQY